MTARLPAGLLVVSSVLASCAGPHEPWVSLARRDAVNIARLPDSVHDARIVVVGEKHRLVEPVDTVKRLISAEGHRLTHVAIEWSVSDQPDIDRYMSGDDVALERVRAGYARVRNPTLEFFSLFSFIRKFNREQPERAVSVRLIDVESPVRNTPGEARDRHMFAQIERILASASGSRVPVYVGPIHAADWHEANAGVRSAPTWAEDRATVWEPTRAPTQGPRPKGGRPARSPLPPALRDWHQSDKSLAAKPRHRRPSRPRGVPYVKIFGAMLTFGAVPTLWAVPILGAMPAFGEVMALQNSLTAGLSCLRPILQR